jgi:undecaprenyl-diphosphatase
VPIVHAIVLGVVQGLTEFLPVSSSGHLLLVPWLFGWHDFAGDAQLEKTFDVALHLGTLVGAVAYFWNDLWRFGRSVVTPSPDRADDRRLAGLLVVATVPAAVAGAVGQSWIDDHLGKIWYIAVALIVFGFVLLVADRRPATRSIDAFTMRDAVFMGIGQALALEPGVSRSGATITVARFRRLDREAATRISFLMSIPIIAGALLVKGVDVLKDGIPDGMAGGFVAGIIASGITGFIAVWGLLRLIRTTGFAPFVVYRVVVGVGVLTLLATNFR